jgi:hypothetical protein
MRRDEARIILLRYRPGTPDREEPEMREALALAQVDEELSRWLADNGTSQQLLRTTFKQIQAPEGLLQQIISEQTAGRRAATNQQWLKCIRLVATITVVGVIGGAIWLAPRPQPDDTLAIFERQMSAYALRGYTMDLQTNDPEQIRAFLKQRRAPANYTLSQPLQKAALMGCAVEGWHSTKVSMICFIVGKPLAPGTPGNFWLFVADQASVKDAPSDSTPQISKVNQLVTATWAEKGKVYMLSTTADESVLREFL